jgi:anti-anti-sigma regulatory factor
MSNRFELPSELNIYSAQTSRDALQAWVSQCSAQGLDHLEVSAAQVSEVDGSGLQLMASMATTQPHWRLVQPSTAFAEACRTLGFAQWLQAQATPASPATATSTAAKAHAKTPGKGSAKTAAKTPAKARSKAKPQASKDSAP